jgi:hypothetical protein
MKMKDACAKCRKRKSCKTQCWPVEEFLKRDNLAVFEKGRGQEITLYPRSREEQRSSLSIGEDKAGDPRRSSREAQAFSTENENPFNRFDANHKQTSVFIKRFFGRWDYQDIAEAHEISVDAARKLYYSAVQRLLAVIMEMDAVNKMTEEERKQADADKSKRYYEKNREALKAKRRERYAKNKAG